MGCHLFSQAPKDSNTELWESFRGWRKGFLRSIITDHIRSLGIRKLPDLARADADANGKNNHSRGAGAQDGQVLFSLDLVLQASNSHSNLKNKTLFLLSSEAS